MAEAPRAEDGAYAGDVTPAEAWDLLKTEADTVLIDVRTDAEHNYVGRPDLSALNKNLSLIMWVTFPGNERNSDFVDQVKALGVKPDQKLLFLCRSGVRSRYTASAMTKAGYPQCYNVLEGFEGDKDPNGHRGTVGGWKVAGLPWVQG
ncbi:MAG: rhodanese-like domain-containing protein [Rhodospirillaceae bacterium]